MSDLNAQMENEFRRDVIKGLESNPKYLSSKYFYDEEGDKIFQEIMNMPEYYVYKSELEIFQKHSAEMARSIDALFNGNFDVVELGAGDAAKSIYLLQALLENWIEDSKTTVPFNYYPIDISEHVINDLHDRLPYLLPGVRILGLVGDYLEKLKVAQSISSKPKLILFLGSSIGNFTVAETKDFFNKLNGCMKPGDLVLTGFDLSTGWDKTPEVILSAYNDKGGVTKKFNLNLLERINKALGTNFVITQFDHTPTYTPTTGACKSFLKSLKDQEIRIGEHTLCHFKKDELLYTEISQKYTMEQLDEIATETCFSSLFQYGDTKGWYVDILWEKK